MRRVLGLVARTEPCGKYWAMWRVLGHVPRTGPCSTYWVMWQVLGHVSRTGTCVTYWAMCLVLGHVARIREWINVYRILVEKCKETDNLEDPGSQGYIVLRSGLKKWAGREPSGFISLRTGNCCCLL